MFSIELWNIIHRTDTENTNNSMEGWHCSFKGDLTSSHSNFWKVLQVLRMKIELSVLMINYSYRVVMSILHEEPIV